MIQKCVADWTTKNQATCDGTFLFEMVQYCTAINPIPYDDYMTTRNEYFACAKLIGQGGESHKETHYVDRR